LGTRFRQPFQMNIFKLLKNIQQWWYITWNIYQIQTSWNYKMYAQPTFIYVVKRNRTNFLVSFSMIQDESGMSILHVFV
jgi:hypothetical protein